MRIVYSIAAFVFFVWGCGRGGFGASVDSVELSLEPPTSNSSGSGASSSETARGAGSESGSSPNLDLAPAELDTAFGNAGRAEFQFAGDNVPWVLRMLQPMSNGQTVVGFHVIGAGGERQPALLRLNPDGSQDMNFGNDGVSQVLEYNGNTQFTSLWVDELAGDIFFGGWASGFALLMRLDLNGEPKPTFGLGNGLSLLPSLDGGAFNSFLVLDDGRIRMGGHTGNVGSDHDLQIVGVNADGTLELTFGEAGQLRLPGPTSEDDFGGFVQLQPNDGSLLAAGSCRNAVSTSSQADFCIVSFEADGALQTSFGTSGWRFFDLGGDEGPRDFQVSSTGDIALVGTASVGADDDLAVVRLTPSGSDASEFGSDGIRIVDFGGNEQGRNILFLHDGSLVIAGDTDISGTRNVFISRFTATGELDVSFGDGGRLLIPSPAQETVWSMAVDASGELLVYGTTAGLEDEDFFVLRVGL